MRRAPRVVLHRSERVRLVELAENGRGRVGRRARIVLAASDGRTDRAIAKELRTAPSTVALWRRRFLAQRLPGLLREAPRSGRPPSLSADRVRAIVRTTLGRRPTDGGRWSARKLARATGVGKTTVQRIWKAHQIVPTRASETLRRNPGSRFVENVTDLVGLYHHPPDRAMAFSVDEAGPGTGFAPLVRGPLAKTDEDRRAAEFRAFLQAIDRETPAHLDVHLLLDGRLAPNHPEVRRWLGRHPRFYLHVADAGREGPSLIDRWWAGIAGARPRASGSPGVVRLQRAFRHHFASPTAAARAFVWTATTEEIRGSASRTRAGRSTSARPA